MPVRVLSQELAEKAQLELFEDTNKLEDGIRHLKDWIVKQPHLKARTDDQWLATYLRGCKFSLELCKQKIDLYYSLRSIAPDINGLKPTESKFMKLLKSGFVLPLMNDVGLKTPRIILLRAGVYDPSLYTPTEVMSVFHAIQQILFMEDDNYVISGAINIMDFQGVSFAHFVNVSYVQIKKMVIAYREAVPTRMKGTHFVKPPKAFETIFNFAKSLLGDKIKKRLIVHKEYDTLYEHIPKEILPTEYGGNGGTLQEIIDHWVKRVEEYGAWFEEDEHFGTDEKLRPGKPKTAAEMFGVEGSFRQLEFD